MLHDIIVALVALLGGYVLSRICWARNVDTRLTRLETCMSFILDHGYNMPKDWRKRLGFKEK